MTLNLTQLIGFGYGDAELAAETQAFAARCDTEGAPLDTARLNVLDTYIRGLISDGLWARIGLLSIACLPNSVHSRINVKSPSDTLATINGSPTFTANSGWKGNSAVANYLEFPNDVTSYNLSQNDSHTAAWGGTDMVNSNAYITGDSSIRILINPSLTSQLLGRITDLTQRNYGASGLGGFYLLSRDNSANTNGAYNGGTYTNVAGASSNPPAGAKMRYPGCGVGGTNQHQGTVRQMSIGQSFDQTQATAYYNRTAALISGLDAI